MTPEPDPHLRFTCFGGLRISVGERGIALGCLRPRSRSVLAMLVVHAHRRVHADELLGAFWPEAPPPAARHRLQVAISAVRGLLGVESIGATVERDGDGYRLGLPAGAVVDVADFDRLLATAAAMADPAPAWRAALELHREPLLADEGAAAWVVDHREACRERAARAAEALVVHCGARGDAAAVLDATSLGLSVDRYRDSLWRARHQALVDLGQPAAAARTQARYAAVLADLGLEAPRLGVGGSTARVLRV